MDEQNNFYISQKEKNWCLENNAKVTYPGHDDYPSSFYSLAHQPSHLFYLGEPLWKTHKLLSVVGSRNPQNISLQWLDTVLGQLLTETQVVLVSGGARGIDQKAHQIAVRLGRPTLVFLPSGLMNMYPYNLKDWISPILKAGGCVVSQFLPSAEMRKRYFRQRNCLIAAVSPMTLIVECRRRSGTLLTAKYALEMGRSLGVMPTFPGESGMGGLDLLCDSPAFVIRDYLDLRLGLEDPAKLIKRKNQEYSIGHPGGK